MEKYALILPPNNLNRLHSETKLISSILHLLEQLIRLGYTSIHIPLKEIDSDLTYLFLKYSRLAEIVELEVEHYCHGHILGMVSEISSPGDTFLVLELPWNRGEKVLLFMDQAYMKSLNNSIICGRATRVTDPIFIHLGDSGIVTYVSRSRESEIIYLGGLILGYSFLKWIMERFRVRPLSLEEDIMDLINDYIYSGGLFSAWIMDLV